MENKNKTPRVMDDKDVEAFWEKMFSGTRCMTMQLMSFREERKLKQEQQQQEEEKKNNND